MLFWFVDDKLLKVEMVFCTLVLSSNPRVVTCLNIHYNFCPIYVLVLNFM